MTQPLSLTDLLERYVPDREPGQCWEWRGYLHPSGYGYLTRFGKWKKAHRWSYETFVGPIPEGMLLRHVCNNKPCVNPVHLRPGTSADNKQDSVVAGTARGGNSYKTQCIHGHPFDEQNTYEQANGERTCRECHRQTEQRRRDRQKGRA